MPSRGNTPDSSNANNPLWRSAFNVLNSEREVQAMKTLCASLLIMVIPLIGGCTEQRPSDKKVLAEPGTRVQRTQPGPLGPVIIDDYYIIPYPAYNQMVLSIQRTLEEIDFRVKEVKAALEVAGKKAPISGDPGIRLKLEEIDMKLSAVRTALDIASRRVPISGDVVQIITYLRPKLYVELDPNVLRSDGKIRTAFNITNRGEHSISIGDLHLTLSTECIRGKDATAGILSPDVDYALQWEFGGFYAAPGQTIKCIADIGIQQAEFEGRPLYYSLCIDTETEPEIVEVLSGLLFDSLETDKLYSISRASFTFAGEISPSAFRYPE